MKIESEKNLAVEFTPSGAITVWAGTQVWNTKHDFMPSLEIYNDVTGNIESYPWSCCSSVRQEEFMTGYSRGLRVYYEGFPFCQNFSFVAFVELMEPEGKLRVGIIPLQDNFENLKSMIWPGPMEFGELKKEHYTVYPLMQGALIPNGWSGEIKLEKRWELDAGQPYSRSAYMPWFGQIRGKMGYWYLCNTPFDAGFSLQHDAGEDCTVGTIWYSQLGRMGYKREATYTFYEECDYNTFCKAFRTYLKETGELCTLREKILKNPAVEKLIGTSIYHDKIYTQHQPGSFHYEEGGVNEYLTTFSEMGERIVAMKERGMEKMFVHIDGWIKEGYDNQHPDTLPPCPKAGGWEGFRALCEQVQKCGFQFAIHDQYRDYYVNAPSYSQVYSRQNMDGKIDDFTLWEGGRQEFLCPEFSIEYVKRNFLEMRKNGVFLDGAYLDVFSCIPLEECYAPLHRVTREQCMKDRRKCLDYVRSLGIIISSEEGTGWAMRDLDLVHHAPYAFDAKEDPTQMCGQMLPECLGFPVPLLNLVYHDCVVIPWHAIKSEIHHQNEFLHALLNGGVAYAAMDYSEEELELVRIVAKWHEKVGLSEMVCHEILSEDGMVQRSRFANGEEITVNFANNTYQMREKEA